MAALLLRRRGLLDKGALLKNLVQGEGSSVLAQLRLAQSSGVDITLRGHSTAERPQPSTPQKPAQPPQTDAKPAVESSAQSLASVPTMPKVLGLGGLIPFIALAAPLAGSIPLLPPEVAANAAILQVGYGATIASFLGGIHWSLAMVNYGNATAKANADRYLWSVIPCLAAWPALGMEPGPGSLVVASTLLGAYFVDRKFTQRGLLPPWYMGLRLPLTVVASSSLLATCIYSILGPKAKKTELAEQASKHTAQ